MAELTFFLCHFLSALSGCGKVLFTVLDCLLMRCTCIHNHIKVHYPAKDRHTGSKKKKMIMFAEEKRDSRQCLTTRVCSLLPLRRNGKITVYIFYLILELQFFISN